jgi:AcrR family transcriptional regulator
VQNDEMPGGVAARIAAATAARRAPNYEEEVRRLLDAALRVIKRTGNSSRARVADIVAEAGLSNDAFYRYFPSKDDLVAALVEDGAHRVATSIARRMATEDRPEDKLRRWVDGLLESGRASHGASTIAVLNQNENFNATLPTGKGAANAWLAAVIHDTLAELGSRDPDLDAQLLTSAIAGRVGSHLWRGTQPDADEADYLWRFCLSAVRGNTPIDTPATLESGTRPRAGSPRGTARVTRSANR